jgi:N-acetyl-anhydromuramyl-L-alanine amidase AmpD
MRQPTAEAHASVATHGTHNPRRIILHTTESNDLKGVADMTGVVGFWRRQGLGYGAHLIIDGEGQTCRCAAGGNIVWATGGANTGSLQIEMVGKAAWSKRFWLLRRRKQLNEVARWLAYWSQHWDIPLCYSTEHGVARHLDFPAGGHHDPGKDFPLGYVISRARQVLAGKAK